MKLLLCLLALAAIFVRALVPAGFMPDFQQAGTPLVICAGVDEKTIYVDDHGQPVEKPSHTEAPCSFALNGAGPVAEAPAAEFVQVASAISFAVADEKIIGSSNASSYEAQGPPFTSI